MSLLAIIPARAGSKGIKNKNLVNVKGYPLIYWSINAARQSTFIDRVVVTTDCHEIAKVSKAFGVDVISRPSHLSTDQTPMAPVITHTINELLNKGISYSNVVLLQPTSPLRTCQHIEEAYQLYLEKNATMVVSVFEPEFNLGKSYIQKSNGEIESAFANDFPHLRRQEMPKFLMPNGAIYLFYAQDFMSRENFAKNNVHPYIMSRADSIDIDTYSDLERLS
ncbi:cytidylyltransferase domain-containing protein [Catenovulum sediminis]|uniref:acylneuraminate cytidylyltransferase family protein n=1 Tax=Catenovulum sediminis TaxID=1740262 RepID=UPI00117FBED0|nr:acylneuraminate cytidylyltransferase family protein [Catenovulum sediminis]